MGSVAAPIVQSFEDVVSSVGTAVEDVGHAVESVAQAVSQAAESTAEAVGKAGESIDKTVNDNIPGGWATIGIIAATIATAGAGGMLAAGTEIGTEVTALETAELATEAAGSLGAGTTATETATLGGAVATDPALASSVINGSVDLGELSGSAFDLASETADLSQSGLDALADASNSTISESPLDSFDTQKMLESAGKGAAKGAATSGGLSAITGRGDPLKAAALGALTGGIMSGAGNALTQTTDISPYFSTPAMSATKALLTGTDPFRSAVGSAVGLATGDVGRNIGENIFGDINTPQLPVLNDEEGNPLPYTASLPNSQLAQDALQGVEDTAKYGLNTGLQYATGQAVNDAFGMPTRSVGALPSSQASMMTNPEDSYISNSPAVGSDMDLISQLMNPRTAKKSNAGSGFLQPTTIGGNSPLEQGTTFINQGIEPSLMSAYQNASKPSTDNSYYTYGKAVSSPSEILSQNPNPASLTGLGFADGGLAMAQGVPMAQYHMPENMHYDGTMNQFSTGNGVHHVKGEGDGQSDDIPAMLADGEYVFDADTVAALGNGSNDAGAEVLDKMREQIRAHKRSAPNDKIPPKAKSPLEYLRLAQHKQSKKA